MEPIRGGATIWARQTIDSEVFYQKPDKWFKIWFYLVNTVNHKPKQKWNRGECYIKTNQIEDATGASIDQVKKCLTWLRKTNMIDTQRSTRGFNIKINNYGIYQDFDNYTSTRKALEKHQRSTTINKNGRMEESISDKSQDKKKPMTPFEEPTVDLDSGEITKPVKKSNAKYPHSTEVYALFEKTLKIKLPAQIYPNKTERMSAENLYTERGIKKIERALQLYKESKDNGADKLRPIIDSPMHLDRKWKGLMRYLNK